MKKYAYFAEGNKVVIKVKNTGICGSDIHMIWQTGYNAGTNFVIGHEFAGEIYDAGNSTTFKVGDIRRAMEKWQAEFFNKTVADIMTRNPKTVTRQTRISEIQKTMN